MTNLMNVMGRIVFWLSWPALHVILHFGFRTRVLIIAKGEVLLVKDVIGSGKWSLPGGGVRHGEAPLDGAIREVYEETGIRLKPAQLTDCGSHTGHNNDKHHYRYQLYTVTLPDQPATKRQRKELSALEWRPLAWAAQDPSVGKVAREIITAWSPPDALLQ